MTNLVEKVYGGVLFLGIFTAITPLIAYFTAAALGGIFPFTLEHVLGIGLPSLFATSLCGCVITWVAALRLTCNEGHRG